MIVWSDQGGDYDSWAADVKDQSWNYTRFDNGVVRVLYCASLLLCTRSYIELNNSGVSIFHFVGKTIPGKINFFRQDIISSAGLNFLRQVWLNFYDW